MPGLGSVPEDSRRVPGSGEEIAGGLLAGGRAETTIDPGASRSKLGGCLGFRGWNQRLKQFVMIKNRLAFSSIKVALGGGERLSLILPFVVLIPPPPL